MGTPRTIGVVEATSGTPTPVLTGAVVAAISFSITNGVATIVLGKANLPKNGYNGPNGYPIQNGTTGASLDIYGGVSGYNNAGSPNGGGNAPGGQQVTLWGFTTATYFNGCTVTVLDCDPSRGSFRFYFNHANVSSTADAGNTAPIPVESFRSVRLECSQSNGTNIVYVGDLNVSSSRYITALTLTGQSAYEVTGNNIRADRIFIDGSASSDCSVLVSVIY